MCWLYRTVAPLDSNRGFAAPFIEDVAYAGRRGFSADRIISLPQMILAKLPKILCCHHSNAQPGSFASIVMSTKSYISAKGWTNSFTARLISSPFLHWANFVEDRWLSPILRGKKMFFFSWRREWVPRPIQGS